MKAKYLLIIGGAIALFYLYQKNKNKKSSTSSIVKNEEIESGGTTTTGGTTTGTTTTGTTTTGNTNGSAGTSQVVTFPTPTPTIRPEKPNLDEIIDLPLNMDLPVLTPGTGVPTEVAIQQGGVRTNPTITPIVTIPSTGGGYIEPITVGGDRDVIGTIKGPNTNTRNVLTQNLDF